MTKKEFAQEAIDFLKAEGRAAVLKEKAENNVGAIWCIAIGDMDASPVGMFSLDEAFRCYQRGGSIKEICRKIGDTYDRQKKQFLPAEAGTDWEWAKKRLFYRVLDLKKNRRVLDEAHAVYHAVADSLAAVVYLAVSDDGDSLISTKVTYPMLKGWGITRGEAENIALRATERDARCFTMKDITDEASGKRRAEDLLRCNGYADPGKVVFTDMLVLTNKRGLNGAASILSKATLRKVARFLGESQFLIIPSSVHEVIAIRCMRAWGSLPSLIREANNSSFTKKADVLSDHLYLFTGEKLVLWPKAC